MFSEVEMPTSVPYTQKQRGKMTKKLGGVADGTASLSVCLSHVCMSLCLHVSYACLSVCMSK